MGNRGQSRRQWRGRKDGPAAEGDAAAGLRPEPPGSLADVAGRFRRQSHASHAAAGAIGRIANGVSNVTTPFILTGMHEAEEPPLTLRAGRLTAELADGNLRSIRHDGVEIIRGIAFLIRDRDWGTHRPEIHGQQVETAPGRFDVRYRATFRGPEDSVISVDVTLSGRDGRLEFAADARTTTGFETNRCGFCVLHPVVGLAGTPVTVEHVDGRMVDTRLPDAIEPWQPFKEIRAITHRAPQGFGVSCRMEGDTFEMEDQRNWSDASYKTYVRPLALPWPYRIAPGETVSQRVLLDIADDRPARPAAARAADQPVTLDVTGPTLTMPAMGLVITPEEVENTLAALPRLKDIGPQTLLCHYDPLAGHGLSALQAYARLAAAFASETVLELALPCIETPAAECRAIARDLAEAGFRPDAVMISPAVDRQSTPPGSAWPACPPLEDVYAAAHAAFGPIPVGGGMLSYFTELNRKRVPADGLAFISHATNPIVHAADDLSVMQTLEALPFITRSVRAIYGDRPYRIGPSTIAMRQNPYGSRTMDNPEGRRIAMAHADPRHNARFGAAFALAYAARVLDARPTHLTLAAMTGPFGLIAAAGEPSPEGSLRPIGTVIGELAARAGQPAQVLHSAEPEALVGILSGNGGRQSLLLANTTPAPRAFRLKRDGAVLMEGIIPAYGTLFEPL